MGRTAEATDTASKAVPTSAEIAAACQGADHHPSAEDVTLLRQWGALQAGFRSLTDDLLSDVERKAGITPSSFQVLWFLMTSEANTAKMHQLAETLGFSTAGTTKVADRLVDAGLVERRPSADDRRVILAKLTPEGLRVASEAAFALVEALKERVVGTVGAERFADLATLIGAFGPEINHC
jgi:DNA-binding MarR family transcriptional regulator